MVIDARALTDGVALLVTGAGGGAGVHAFRTVGDSPLKRPIAALVLLFAGFAVNALLRIAIPGQIDPYVLRAITYTVVTVFVLLMVYFEMGVNASERQ